MLNIYYKILSFINPAAVMGNCVKTNINDCSTAKEYFEELKKKHPETTFKLFEVIEDITERQIQ